MGIGIPTVKLYFELQQRGFFKDIKSVVELGSQEIHISKEDMQMLLRMYNLPNAKFSYRSSTKSFYGFLGVKNYTCIDINEEHNSIKIDLNYPLDDKSLFGKFDFVTDFGCAEHVFNISEAYRTMHRLCKPSGFIFAQQALYKGNGYYLFDPGFYESLAAANNYKILFSGFFINERYIISCSRELLDLFDWSKIGNKPIGVMYLMQKQNNNDFAYPYQGGALSEIKRNLGYKIFFDSNPPSRSYVPIYEPRLDRNTVLCLSKKLLNKYILRK